ncbi:lyase [Nannocystis radixulma]|uniref:Lyase n=1 Tax=Nannocystis radixulma TaxID=2995305 RepID=A0ABT5BQD1_9BACT|nr:lyase [Nannocystis radixulma]MDC0675933.1 lyase [Nannocystis radixulma]
MVFMHRWMGVISAVIGLAGCGDGGRATASATAGQTDSTTAAGPTTTATTGTASATQGPTEDVGTASNSASEATTALPTTTQDITITGTVTSSTTGPTSGPDTTSSTGPDTTTGDPCGGGGGSGGFDFSYLWVANTSQGSISKVNTQTLTEEGRYYADPNPAGASSSRTSVNIDGHFVVVSNRASYSVTKFAADKGDCVDKNGDGVIQTSANKDDILPWGADECMLWNTPVSPVPFGYNGGPRGTAWAPGDFNPAACKYENQKVWVGWLDAPTHAIIGRFDGVTGVQDATIPLDGWSSQISPYGAAADGNGYVWFINVYQELVRIDTETLEVKRYPGEGIQFYGMTVDGKGNVWFGPYSNGNVAMFDAQTETFHQIPNSAENHRGIAVDSNGMAWVAANAGGTHGCGLNQIDTNTLTAVQFHTFEQCSTPVGVSIDVDGFVWMVDYGGWAYRIDPNTYVKTQVLIAGDHYTYSDMTGGGLFNAVMPG